MVGGFSRDQNEGRQTSQQAVSEEIAHKGWIGVEVARSDEVVEEMERMSECKGNDRMVIGREVIP